MTSYIIKNPELLTILKNLCYRMYPEYIHLVEGNVFKTQLSKENYLKLKKRAVEILKTE